MAVFNLSDLNGTNGFVLGKGGFENWADVSISAAGDVNGDGIDDLLLGHYDWTWTNEGRIGGKVFVIYGKTTGFDQELELVASDNIDVITFTDTAAFHIEALNVSTAGDMNGDGFDDFVVGAPGWPYHDHANIPAESYVVFGSAAGIPSEFDFVDLDGETGFTIREENPCDYLGVAVSHIGDFNGDGFDDIVLGAPGGGGEFVYHNSGAAYVVFGSAAGFEPSLDVETLDGSNGLRILGKDQGQGVGNRIASAGDVNADGIDDLIIGVPRGASAEGYDLGESIVVFGRSEFDADLELADIDGSNGFVVSGSEQYQEVGYGVASAGDVNGDGIDDLLISTRGAESHGRNSEPEAYVVFGSSDAFDARFDVSTFDGANGFAIAGLVADWGAGTLISSAGDVNGDGFDDIIVGSPLADAQGKTEAGKSYVIFGTDAGFDARLDVSKLNGTNGFVINGADDRDRSGAKVVSAGDVNGDGFDDLMISTDEPHWFLDDSVWNQNEDRNFTYVVFGSATIGQTASPILGQEAAGRTGVYGSIAGEVLDGGAGADVLRGQGGDDMLYGRAGSDWFEGGSGADRLWGGGGADRAMYHSSREGLTVDLLMADRNTGIAAGDTFDSIEQLAGSHYADELRGTYADDTLLGEGGDDAIFGRDGDDALYGRTGNDHLIGGAGADQLFGGAGVDRALYKTAAEGVVADLQFSDRNTGDAAGDAYSSIEQLFGSKHSDILRGSVGDDTLAGAAGDDILFGRRGDDVLYGGRGEDHLYGGTGSDRLFGGDGDDHLQGGAGTNRLDGGLGDDWFIAGAGQDHFFGGSGVDCVSYESARDGILVDYYYFRQNTGDAAGDTYDSVEFLIGTGFDDVLRGEYWNDTISGGAGDDIITGRGGADVLYGNEGDDLFYVGQNGDVDRFFGGQGTDMVHYKTAQKPVIADLSMTERDWGETVLDVFSSIENLRGSKASDRLWGSRDDNWLGGGSGHDSLFGRGGDDTLEGHNGRDTLAGGAGEDELWGGAGADAFRFTVNSETDMIMDFTDNEDTILLNDALWSGTLTAAEVLSQFARLADGVAVLDFGEGNVLRIEGVADIGILENDIEIY